MGWGGPLLTLESLSDITSETILQDFVSSDGIGARVGAGLRSSPRGYPEVYSVSF